jgi:RNA polymerase sigma-70 factor (ECF subfamily)
MALVVAFVERLKRDEDEAWNELVNRYFNRLYRYFRQLGQDRATSEDLTQETLLAAFCNIRRLRNAHALETWIYRIATNRFRREQRRRRPAANPRPPEEGDPPDLGEGVLSDLEHAEVLLAVRRGTQKLPRQLREVIVLHYWQGLTLSGVARVVGVPLGTVKNRLHAGLKALESMLQENGYGVTDGS